MKTKKHDTQWMVSVALMAAIVILLANTPLGMIQLPIIKATTVHIPVIIGAILLGPSAGAILGFVFGVCSLVSNTMAPTLLSFAFSPFMSTTGIPGAIKAIWISVGCRMLIGIAAGWLWILFNKLKVNQIICTSNRWIRRIYGEHDHCYGKYLSVICTAVCTGKGCSNKRRMGTCYGNCYSIWYSGSNCCSSTGACNRKSADPGIKKNEFFIY